MKEMIITATYKGKDGSLGYTKGKEYKLRMTHLKGVNIGVKDSDVRNPGGYCQYESMISFLENWKNVKGVTPEEPKRDKKEIAINFTNFCGDIKDCIRIRKALKFYNEKFEPEKVLEYFQNWSLLKSDKKYKNGVILTNNNTEGWKVKMWINDGSEYTFCSGSDGTDKPEDSQWQYLPGTMSEFISDCLRYEDVELLFSKKAIEKIYG